MIYILNHAEDRVLIIDPTFIPLVEGVQDQLQTIEVIIIASSKDSILENNLNNSFSYEDLIKEEPDEYDWPRFDEDTAASLCYTSGTTGNPKGVLYSHRSIIFIAILRYISSVIQNFCVWFFFPISNIAKISKFHNHLLKNLSRPIPLS